MRACCRQSGFSVLELIVVVGIIGIAASVGVPKLMMSLRRANTKEAVDNVTRLFENVSDVYRHDKQLPPATAMTPTASCCGHRGDKCSPDEANWNGTWRTLKFALDDPHYYRYQYTVTATGFAVTAVGDLDCDGVLSKFEMSGTVGEGGMVTGSPMTLENELE